ncbi:MAG: phosphate ABC transporter permease subunit PstC [Candidatus Omnitrophota bacterium]
MSLFVRRRRKQDRWPFIRVVSFAAFVVALGLVGVIFGFLLKDSLPVWRSQGLGFLFGRQWYVGQAYGALPMVYGTVVVTFIAVCLALPLALGSAIIVSEVFPGRLRLAAKMIIELLAGIPGVVYGLLGIAILTTMVRETFGLIDGNCIFTAGLLLGIMILPTIMTLCEDALHAVPNRYRSQAFALGLCPAQTIIYVVLPQAARGIIGAILLGVSRAMGETIAVMLVIGSIDRIPHPFYNLFVAGQTITSKLGREAQEALGMGYHWNVLIALGFILFIMTMGITFIGEAIVTRPRET